MTSTLPHLWNRIDTELSEADKLRPFGPPPECRILGTRPFVDGVTRQVYEDPDGRQWVIGYTGERVYGWWFAPADEPVVLENTASDR